jgi:hypothetical protein
MTSTPRYTRTYHPELAEKLEARTTPDPITGCWNWTLGVNADGYGNGLYHQGKQHRSHRLAFLVSMGDLPPPEFPVRHLCNNPSCCRPDHLAVGTSLENAQDTVKAGRHRTRRETAEHRRARALALRGASGTIEQIAARYNVHPSTARRALRGRTWANLPGVREAKPYGEHKRKLTESDVRSIRQSDESNKVLAARYGVSAPNIYAIRKRVSWKHVTP